jgi:hypothetical protein
MSQDKPYHRSETYMKKKWDWLLPTLSEAWMEFQGIATQLPDSLEKETVLFHIQQANQFYMEQHLSLMKPVIFCLFDFIQTSRLPEAMKEKALYVFSLFKDFMFFDEARGEKD